MTGPIPGQSSVRATPRGFDPGGIANQATSAVAQVTTVKDAATSVATQAANTATALATTVRDAGQNADNTAQDMLGDLKSWTSGQLKDLMIQALKDYLSKNPWLYVVFALVLVLLLYAIIKLVLACLRMCNCCDYRTRHGREANKAREWDITWLLGRKCGWIPKPTSEKEKAMVRWYGRCDGRLRRWAGKLWGVPPREKGQRPEGWDDMSEGEPLKSTAQV